MADREAGVFTRPDQVRRVRHEGPDYSVDAIHLSEPSPQRTPVLYQAGTSPAGRAFAGRDAECVFMSGPSKQVFAPRLAAVRAAAGEAGRDPDAVKIFAMMTVIVAPTDAEAQGLLAEYRCYADPVLHGPGLCGFDSNRPVLGIPDASRIGSLRCGGKSDPKPIAMGEPSM